MNSTSNMNRIITVVWDNFDDITRSKNEHPHSNQCILHSMARNCIMNAYMRNTEFRCDLDAKI